MQIDLETSVAADARILIVDDQPSNISGLSRLLEKDGYAICISLTNPLRVVGQFSSIQPDLVLLDWHMEPIGGLEVLQRLKEHVSPEDMPPILVLTADDSPEVKREALAAGAIDFLAKPLDYSEMLLRIRNLLQLRRLQLQSLSTNRLLEETVRKRTAELERAVAELNETQQQIIQQERLRALGSMAAGVAHDFNNVLTIVRGYSEMFLKQESLQNDPAKVRDAFSTIWTAAGDAGESVKQLREFYRPRVERDTKWRPVDFNELARQAVRFSAPRWQTQARADGIDVEVSMDLQPNLPLINGAPVELREAFINLLFNAVDAMPRGGQIVVRTFVEEDTVVAEVEDSGVGMTEETRRHCLEPFYTTKGETGTGLGLALVYGVVHRHGGVIRINTALSQGTQISLALPMAKVALDGESVDRELIPEHFLKVLVVDDQQEICDLMKSYLELDFHFVVTATCGEDALEKFRRDSFDLVITDLVMPGTSGAELARAIKEIKPEEPVILFTAFLGPHEEPPKFVDLLLSKPASLSRIREAISTAMAGSGKQDAVK